MKIDIVVPDLRIGGFERVRVLLANEFSRLGHQVTIVMLTREGTFISNLRPDVSIVELGVFRGRHAVLALARSINQRKPDAVLAGVWPLTTAAALAKVCSRHKFRLVLSEHNQLSQQYATWGTFNLIKMRVSLAVSHRVSNASIAVSKGVAADIEHLGFLSSGSVHPIYNPVELLKTPDRGKILAAERLWGVPSGKRILTVGSLKLQKNHALLLKAIARTEDDSRLIIVGGGSLLNELENLAIALGIQNRVIFAGFSDDPAPFYATADMFVLSSDYEGMPNVLNEALAFRLPVVSTNCPSGPSEILRGGQLGMLVPTRDVEALSDAIKKTLADQILRSTADISWGDLSIEATAQSYLKLLLP